RSDGALAIAGWKHLNSFRRQSRKGLLLLQRGSLSYPTYQETPFGQAHFDALSSRTCLTVFGAKRERDTTRNGSAIMVGSTQKVSVGRCFKPGIRWALST